MGALFYTDMPRRALILGWGSGKTNAFIKKISPTSRTKASHPTQPHLSQSVAVLAQGLELFRELHARFMPVRLHRKAKAKAKAKANALSAAWIMLPCTCSAG